MEHDRSSVKFDFDEAEISWVLDASIQSPTDQVLSSEGLSGVLGSTTGGLGAHDPKSHCDTGNTMMPSCSLRTSCRAKSCAWHLQCNLQLSNISTWEHIRTYKKVCLAPIHHSSSLRTGALNKAATFQGNHHLAVNCACAAHTFT